MGCEAVVKARRGTRRLVHDQRRHEGAFHGHEAKGAATKPRRANRVAEKHGRENGAFGSTWDRTVDASARHVPFDCHSARSCRFNHRHAPLAIASHLLWRPPTSPLRPRTSRSSTNSIPNRAVEIVPGTSLITTEAKAEGTRLGFRSSRMVGICSHSFVRIQPKAKEAADTTRTCEP